MGIDWLGAYLLEDLGTGDVTSDALFDARRPGAARIVARQACTLSGLAPAREVFARLGAGATPAGADVMEGTHLAAGAGVLQVQGPAAAILAGERVALNLLARMSGIATATRQAADALRAAGGTGRIAGTRKTTPGFRLFEKQAIVAGGGQAHREGLWDAAMVKDNHLEALAGRPLPDVPASVVADAVRRTKAANPGRAVTCEVESLPHAMAAAAAGADWLLVDNRDGETGAAWAREVRRTHPRILIEASGGITVATVASFAWADRISMGSLTQRAPGCDFSLEWQP